jgi:hypothetical protein
VGQVQGRIVGSVAAFAFADVWVTAGLFAAFECALAAALGYGIAVAVERDAATSARLALSQHRRRLRSRFEQPARHRRPRPRRQIAEPPTAETTYGW